MNKQEIRCNMCYNTYKETEENQIYDCDKCNTGEYLMEDFIQ